MEEYIALRYCRWLYDEKRRETWEEAAKRAVERASKSLRDLRVAEVTKQDLKIEDGKVVAYRAKVSLSFKYEGE